MRYATYREQMDELRAEYEAGDKSALALAIEGCGLWRKPMPRWVVQAWSEGYWKVILRAADWNDLFGAVKVKSPKQQARERRELERMSKLVKALPTISAPIERGDSEGAFRELAEKIGTGITPRQVRELYYKKVNYKGREIRALSSSVLNSRGTRK